MSYDLIIEKWFDQDIPPSTVVTTAISGAAVCRSVAVAAADGTLAVSGAGLGKSVGTGQEVGSQSDSGIALGFTISVGAVAGTIAISGTATTTARSTAALSGVLQVAGTSIPRTTATAQTLGVLYIAGVASSGSAGIGDVGGNISLDIEGTAFFSTIATGDVLDYTPPPVVVGDTDMIVRFRRRRGR